MRLIDGIERREDVDEEVDLVLLRVEQMGVVVYDHGHDYEWVDEDIGEQVQVQFGIVVADAVAHPVAVVVHQVDTPSTPPTVIVTLWLQCNTHLTLPPLSTLPTHRVAQWLLIGPESQHQPANIDWMVAQHFKLIQEKHSPIDGQEDEGDYHNIIIKMMDGEGSVGVHAP